MSAGLLSGDMCEGVFHVKHPDKIKPAHASTRRAGHAPVYISRGVIILSCHI